MTLNGRVVLARHRAGDAVYHLLPGGGVGWGETLEEALVREIAEETGLEARAERLLFVNDTIDPSGSRHVVNLTFEARVTGGALTDGPDDPRVEAVDLVSPDSLGTLDLRPPIAEELLGVLQTGTVQARYLGPRFTEGRR
jgi:ADP-ribose pyrophosphatase YjhB (NUDIX family)